MDGLGVGQHGFHQQGAVAAARIPLEAEQGGGAFEGHRAQLRRLRHRLRQLELTGIDAAQACIWQRNHCFVDNTGNDMALR